jgi:hypothetical protein
MAGIGGNPTEDSHIWPSMQDLNTRLRRVITAYQRNYKKEELKQQQKAKVSVSDTLKPVDKYFSTAFLYISVSIFSSSNVIFFLSVSSNCRIDYNFCFGSKSNDL